MKLEQMKITIEGAATNKSVLEGMRTGASLLNDLNRETNPDDVAEEMDNIEESMAEAEEASNIMAEPFAGMAADEVRDRRTHWAILSMPMSASSLLLVRISGIYRHLRRENWRKSWTACWKRSSSRCPQRHPAPRQPPTEQGNARPRRRLLPRQVRIMANYPLRRRRRVPGRPPRLLLPLTRCVPNTQFCLLARACGWCVYFVCAVAFWVLVFSSCQDADFAELESEMAM